MLNARAYDRTAFSDEVRGWQWYECVGEYDVCNYCNYRPPCNR